MYSDDAIAGGPISVGVRTGGETRSRLVNLTLKLSVWLRQGTVGRLYHSILFSFLVFEAVACGQSVTLSVGSASGVPGGTVTVTVNTVSAGGAPQPVLGVQWSFSYSAGHHQR